MRKFILFLCLLVFNYAIAQPVSVSASYAGSVFNNQGTFNHLIDLSVSQPMDVMIECDGYVSYYTVNQGTTRLSIEFNGGKGSLQKRVKITAIGPPMILIIKSVVFV